MQLKYVGSALIVLLLVQRAAVKKISLKNCQPLFLHMSEGFFRPKHRSYRNPESVVIYDEAVVHRWGRQTYHWSYRNGTHTERWILWNVHEVRNKSRNMNDSCFIRWANCSPKPDCEHGAARLIMNAAPQLLLWVLAWDHLFAYLPLLRNNGRLPDHHPVCSHHFLLWNELSDF